MTYDQLKTMFAKRMLTRIVNVTRACPLRFAEIAVYSCLVQRANHAKGARQVQISRATSLHESTAVPKALASLQRHGLVEKRGDYWWATEPTETSLPWFKYRGGTDGQKWHGRFSYWWAGIRQPKSPLTSIQTGLYFKLINLQGRCITVRGLARLLGVDNKTVCGGLKRLRKLNLVDEFTPNTPTDDQLMWFRQGREKPAFRASESFGCFDDPERDEAVLSKRFVDQAGTLLTDAGLSERQAVNYVRSVLQRAKQWPVVYSFFAKFESFFLEIQKQHQANVAKGKYTRAKNCLGFLNHETKKRVAAMRRGS